MLPASPLAVPAELWAVAGGGGGFGWVVLTAGINGGALHSGA